MGDPARHVEQERLSRLQQVDDEKYRLCHRLRRIRIHHRAHVDHPLSKLGNEEVGDLPEQDFPSSTDVKHSRIDRLEVGRARLPNDDCGLLSQSKAFYLRRQLSVAGHGLDGEDCSSKENGNSRG
jgi:hypothetical protein